MPRWIFDALLEAGGEGDRETIAAIAGTDAGVSTFRNALTKLRNHGLIEPGRDRFKLTEPVLEAWGRLTAEGATGGRAC